MNNLPKSRTAEIIVQELENEVLIYDLTVNKAFCLNQTSAEVWNQCDGQTSVEEISAAQQIPSEIVLFALERLSKENLLAEKFETGLPTDKVSRRKLLRVIGTTAVVLPLISSVVAPNIVQAQSCLQPGAPFCVDPQATDPACGTATSAAADNICCSGDRSFIVTFNPANGSCCSSCFNFAPPTPV